MRWNLAHSPDVAAWKDAEMVRCSGGRRLISFGVVLLFLAPNSQDVGGVFRSCCRGWSEMVDGSSAGKSHPCSGSKSDPLRLYAAVMADKKQQRLVSLKHTDMPECVRCSTGIIRSTSGGAVELCCWWQSALVFPLWWPCKLHHISSRSTWVNIYVMMWCLQIVWDVWLCTIYFYNKINK